MSERLIASLAGPSGAPVVALGTSIGTHQGLWDPQAAVLGRRFRLLRFEFRGHGPAGAQSPAPPGPYSIAELGTDVLDVLNRFDLEQVAYCGVSLGGMVGMWLAANAPARISRLALLCTAAHMPPASMWTERAATARSEGLGALVGPTTGRWFTAAFRAQQPAAVAAVAAMFTGTSAEGYAGCAEAIADMDQRESITAISAPTLVVAGAEDPSTPPWQGARLARSIPGAALTVVRGAAHLANYQDPGPVTAALAAHLGPLLV
jgi:3-oxoadipate enol-lactonase